MPKLKVNNINLYYESYGQGEPIVLINGFGMDHTLWRDLAIAYSKNYRAIIFDNRGIGQSDCPDYPYTIEMMADDAASLIQTLQLEKVHLVGSSMGGNIVQMLCYKYPALVKSAVIANSTAQWNIRTKLWGQTFLELLKINTPIESVIKFNSLFVFSEKFLSQPGIIEQLIQMGRGPVTFVGYTQQMHAINTFDSNTWIKHINVPCLIVSSDEDLMVSIEQAKQLASVIPQAEYFCFKGAGHMPQFEQPENFKQLVIEFIAKHKN